MLKLPPCQIASRTTGLLLIAACLPSLVAPAKLSADEPSLTDVTRAAENVKTAPRRRFELSLKLVELDKSLITDDESALWKLVPWAKVEERYTRSEWSAFYNQPQLRRAENQAVVPPNNHSVTDVIRKQVQQGHRWMYFTIPQETACRFVEETVQKETGKVIRDRTGIATESSGISFDLPHHPLSLRPSPFALRPQSRIRHYFRVMPRPYRDGIQLSIDDMWSEATALPKVTTPSAPSKSFWSWLASGTPPSRERASGSTGLTDVVPPDQALVVFSVGDGDGDKEPGKPSLLIIVPKEIDAVADNSAPAVPAVADAASPSLLPETTLPIQPAAFPLPLTPAAALSPAQVTSVAVTPAAATDDPPTRPRRRAPSELKALHDDVRALREDVRRLSELLEKRLVAKDVPQHVPGNSEAVPQADTRGKWEPQVQPNVLLNFTATWCSPCQKMQPIVLRLEREGCPIQTIDVDKSPDATRRFHVESIPCFIRLNEGKEIERVSGLVTERELRRLVSKASSIQTRLEKRVSLKYGNTGLFYVVKKLSEQTGINIVLDKRALEEEGLTAFTHVSIEVEDITAQSALRLILEPLNLATVEQDEVLLVTSRQRTKGEQTVAVYPVADVFPLLDPEGNDTPERNEKCLKRIGEIIQSTISPDSWDTVGGQASMRYYETTRSLIVRQTSDVHAEIAKLLAQFRELKTVTNTDGKVNEAIPSTERPKGEAPDSGGELKLSAVGKRAKPVSLLVGQRGELQFAGRIRSVEGHDGAILQLSRVAGESLLVQGASQGTTLLRVSVDGVADQFEVIVVVSPSTPELARPEGVVLRAGDTQPQKVSLRVNQSLEVTASDWLTRVDGFDPQLVNVTASEKDRLRITGQRAGTTTLTLITKAGKSHTLEVTVRSAEATKQHPVVRRRIATRADLPGLISVPLEGGRQIELDADISRINIDSDSVSDIRQLDPRRVLVIGRQAGLARLTFWFEKTAEPLELFVLVPPLSGERTSRKDRVPNYLLPQIYPVYPAIDLVIPVADEASGKPTPKSNDLSKLIDLITTTIEPASWKANGGPCSIEVIGFTRTKTLLIRATPKMHKAIAELVNALRGVRGIQVILETRLLQVADDSVLEKAGLKDEFDPHTRSIRLDERGAKRLVEVVEAEHGESLILPNFTLLSGSFARVGSDVRGQDDQKHAIEMYVNGLVSKDHKCLRLGVAVTNQFGLYEPLMPSQALNDGGYLLLDKTDQLLLAKSYFSKSVKPKGRVLILVQPRIVIPEKKDVNKVVEDGVNLGGVRPRIIIQEEEEELLGIPAKEDTVRDVPNKQ